MLFLMMNILLHIDDFKHREADTKCHLLCFTAERGDHQCGVFVFGRQFYIVGKWQRMFLEMHQVSISFGWSVT